MAAILDIAVEGALVVAPAEKHAYSATKRPLGPGAAGKRQIRPVALGSLGETVDQCEGSAGTPAISRKRKR